MFGKRKKTKMPSITANRLSKESKRLSRASRKLSKKLQRGKPAMKDTELVDSIKASINSLHNQLKQSTQGPNIYKLPAPLGVYNIPQKPPTYASVKSNGTYASVKNNGTVATLTDEEERPYGVLGKPRTPKTPVYARMKRNAKGTPLSSFGSMSSANLKINKGTPPRYSRVNKGKKTPPPVPPKGRKTKKGPKVAPKPRKTKRIGVSPGRVERLKGFFNNVQA